MSEDTKPLEQMTAWERWELASFDPAPPPPPPPPEPEEPPPPEIQLPTAEEIEAIYQQARDEGYAAGLEAGKAESQEAAHTALQPLLETIKQLDLQLSSMDEQVADDLLQLSLEIARQVVRQAVHLQPDSILTVIREALLELPHQHTTIYLNSEDLALAKNHLGEQLSHAGHRLFEDAALSRGDCRIEAGSTHIDATLANRWRRVVATLGSQLRLDAPLPPPEVPDESSST